MKRPEYVAVVTGIYARLLEEGRGPTAAELAELERGLLPVRLHRLVLAGPPRRRHVRHPAGERPGAQGALRRARTTYEKDDRRTVPVDFSCSVTAGEPCALTASDPDGHTVTVTGPVPEAARTRPLDGLELEARLRKTGGTAYRAGTVVTLVDEGLSLPVSAVNDLRRRALAALTDARTAPPARRELPAPPLPDIDCSAESPPSPSPWPGWTSSPPPCWSGRPARVYLPLEEARGPGGPAGRGTAWCVILPRVWRDRDEPALRAPLERARSLGFTGALIGNIGHLPLVRGTGLRTVRRLRPQRVQRPVPGLSAGQGAGERLRVL